MEWNITSMYAIDFTSGRKVTQGEEERKKGKMPLIASTTFCLQLPWAAHAHNSDKKYSCKKVKSYRSETTR
jgi:hypothetical protein